MLEQPPAVSMTVLKFSHHHQQLSAAKDKSSSVRMSTGGGTAGNICPAATTDMQTDCGDDTTAAATAAGIVKQGVPLSPQPQVVNHQQQTTNSRSSHISFSVAALLADTRPTPRHRASPAFLSSQSPPLESSTPYHSEQPLTSSDDDLNDDESEQGSAVDVEVLRDSNSPGSTPRPLHPTGSAADVLSARFMLAGGHGPGGGGSVVTPVRPTPFSALAAAAAAYSAGLQHHQPAPHHQPPAWATSTLVGHYPGAMFPGPAAAAAAAFAAAGLGGSPGEQDGAVGRRHRTTA
jgi:hypothetical protein